MSETCSSCGYDPEPAELDLLIEECEDDSEDAWTCPACGSQCGFWDAPF